ncbi:unnamed protein product [Cuscuta campestris]|uniref:Uncharacterized protein n=1 Tax=Cuscuta campestris TaxID=132261 RepID=A0A484KYR4_9ASTE|nr:unnamed protein product [Cuscuta campestris]
MQNHQGDFGRVKISFFEETLGQEMSLSSPSVNQPGFKGRSQHLKIHRGFLLIELFFILYIWTNVLVGHDHVGHGWLSPGHHSVGHHSEVGSDTTVTGQTEEFNPKD